MWVLVLATVAIFTVITCQSFKSSPFVASYEQQGGAGDLFYPGLPSSQVQVSF